jgi:uncharacterized protein (TIGR02996 family)
MSDRLGLITAIHEQPEDDLPRLAYADWLEEQGEDEHAEFVRVELRLARMGRDHEDYRPLFARELELIRAHKDEWFGRWRAGWCSYEVRRGFIESVAARSPAAVLPCADWLYSHHALRDLWVNGGWSELRPLWRHPLAGAAARLTLLGGASPDHPGSAAPCGWWLPGGTELKRWPLALSVCGHEAGLALVEDVLASPHAGRIGALNLSANNVGAAGLRLLLDNLGRLPRLKALALEGRMGGSRRTVVPNVGPEGATVLANHPAAGQLEEINLCHNRLDGAALAALAASPHLGAVRRLGLSPAPAPERQEQLRARFGEAVSWPRETS